MTTEPEALVQLARLAGLPQLVSVSPAAVPAAVEARLPQVAGGLLEEAVASDDVLDRDSALEFIDRRLEFLSGLLSPDQVTHLRAEVLRRVDAW